MQTCKDIAQGGCLKQVSSRSFLVCCVLEALGSLLPMTCNSMVWLYWMCQVRARTCLARFECTLMRLSCSKSEDRAVSGMLGMGAAPPQVIAGVDITA